MSTLKVHPKYYISVDWVSKTERNVENFPTPPRALLGFESENIIIRKYEIESLNKHHTSSFR